MQFAARSVFAMNVLLCLEGFSVYKLFQGITFLWINEKLRSGQKSGYLEILIFQYHAASHIVFLWYNKKSSKLSSGFWKKRKDTCSGGSWNYVHSSDDAGSNNTVRRGAGEDF